MRVGSKFMKRCFLFLMAATLVASLGMFVTNDKIVTFRGGAKRLSSLRGGAGPKREGAYGAPNGAKMGVKRCSSSLDMLMSYDKEASAVRFFNISDVSENSAIWYAGGIMLSNLLMGTIGL